MRLKARFFVLLALIGSTSYPAIGDDGVLPRGKTPAPGHKMVVPETASAIEPLDCASYIANANSGEIHFTQDGKFAYFLSRQTGELGQEGKAFLYEADLENFRSKRIVSLRAGENASLIGHGQPLEAMTVMDFHKNRAGCGEGVSAGVGIKWIGQQKIIKSYPLGNYKIVPTDTAPVLADLDQRNIKIIDLSTFQKRTLVSFADKVIPLFVKNSPLQLTGFRTEQNELVRYDAQESEPSAVLRLKKSMRIVQEGELFGIVTGAEDGKVLQIKQIKGWSGDSFRGIDIKLPEGFLADRVSVQIDFRSGLCLVAGANPALKRDLRQVLLYNGAKSQVDRLLKAPEGQYFSQAVFVQKNRKVLILSRSLQDESVQSLRIGDMGSGDWREIAVIREPVSPAPTEKAVEKVPEKPEKIEKKID